MLPYSRDFEFARSRSSVCSMPGDERLSRALERENLFGSGVTMGYFINSFLMLYTGLVDKIQMSGSSPEQMQSHIQHGDWGRILSGISGMVVSSICLLSLRGHKPVEGDGIISKMGNAIKDPDHNISASSSLYNIPALIISGCKSYVNAFHGNRPEQAWAYACTFVGCFLNFLHNFGYDGKEQTSDDLIADQAMPGQEVRFSSSSSSICNPVRMILSRESSTIIALSAVAITFYESVKHMGESHKAMSSLMASALISAALRLGLYFHQTELDKRHEQENSGGKS